MSLDGALGDVVEGGIGADRDGGGQPLDIAFICAAANQPAGVDPVGRHDTGGGGLQVGGGEPELAAAAQTSHDDAAQPVGTPQDPADLPHVPVLEALADPRRGPATPLVGADGGDDLHLEAVLATDLLQGGGVPGVAPTEADVVADDDRASPEQLLQPGAHEVLRALGGEVEGVGDDQDRVETEVPQGGQAVGQGGDEGQVGLGLVDATGVGVEGDRDGQGPQVAVGELMGELDDASQDRLMPAVDAVEDAHRDHGARPSRSAQARWHLLGAVPDLHCRCSCSHRPVGAPRPCLHPHPHTPAHPAGSGEVRARDNPATGARPDANQPPSTRLDAFRPSVYSRYRLSVD